MSNRTLFLMTGLVIFCIIVLLVLNAAPFLMTNKVETYIKFNDVRGMAVEHKDKLYTLNFKQQTEVIEAFNKSIPIKSSELADKNPKLEIAKIIIYRFDGPDLTIVPIEYSKNNLIFSCKDWNPDGFLKDVTNGNLKNILAQTYDP